MKLLHLSNMKFNGYFFGGVPYRFYTVWHHPVASLTFIMCKHINALQHLRTETGQAMQDRLSSDVCGTAG